MVVEDSSGIVMKDIGILITLFFHTGHGTSQRGSRACLAVRFLRYKLEKGLRAVYKGDEYIIFDCQREGKRVEDFQSPESWGCR